MVPNGTNDVAIVCNRFRAVYTVVTIIRFKLWLVSRKQPAARQERSTPN
jgi:hypothetical protein